MSYSDVVIAARLAALAEKQGWSAAPRFSRDLKSRDLNEGSCILLGSSLSNPWVSLFEGELNFQAGWNSQAEVPYFRNREPRPGEADAAACRKLLDWKGVQAPGSEPHYRLEVLLHTKALAGAARDTTVVAARSTSRG